jgi:hypothetical protein
MRTHTPRTGWIDHAGDHSHRNHSQMIGQQTETPALSLQRFMVEMYYTNVKTYTASRCVSRGAPGLPHGLKAK